METRPEKTSTQGWQGETPTQEFLAGAKGGDPRAFDRLVRPQLGYLLALCRRLTRGGDAEELLQEGLTRSWSSIHNFRGETSFRSWLVSILYRLACDPRRFRGTRPLPGQSSLEDPIPDTLEEEPLERITSRELLQRVEQAMERLPLRQRTALHLRAVQGWSYEEIAKTLATSRGAIRTAVFEARSRLRQRLGDLL